MGAGRLQEQMHKDRVVLGGLSLCSGCDGRLTIVVEVPVKANPEAGE